jgi:hypothetical protein
MVRPLMLRTQVLDPPRGDFEFCTLLVTRLLGVLAETRVFVYAGEVLVGPSFTAHAFAQDLVGLVCCAHLLWGWWCGVVE